MASLGDTITDAWKRQDAQAFGRIAERLRYGFKGVRCNHADLLQLLRDCLTRRGALAHELPSSADLDALLYEYEQPGA